MPKPNEFFTYNSDINVELHNCMRKFTATITAKSDEIARAAVESVRGSSVAEEIEPAKRIVASFRCSVCGEHTHTSSGYVPLFCQRCGRLFDYEKEGRYE